MRWERGWGRAAVTVVAVIATAVVIAACGRDTTPTRPPVGSPAAAAPSATCASGLDTPPTALTRGTATIRITTGDQQAAVLDRIADETLRAVFDPVCPARAQAEWTTSTDSWQLTVMGGTGAGSPTILSIRRHTGEPPLSADGSPALSDPAPCSIAFTAISASLFAGHADCHGLRWYDDEAGTGAPNSSPVPGLPPFDASITFNAQP